MKIPRHEQLNSKFVACGTYLGILIVVSEKSVCTLLFCMQTLASPSGISDFCFLQFLARPLNRFTSLSLW